MTCATLCEPLAARSSRQSCATCVCKLVVKGTPVVLLRWWHQGLHSGGGAAAQTVMRELKRERLGWLARSLFCFRLLGPQASGYVQSVCKRFMDARCLS